MEDIVITKCRNLTITSLQIRKLEAKIGNGSVVDGGVISVEMNANSFAEKEGGIIDKETPLCVEIDVNLIGKNDKEDTDLAFSCQCKTRGLFVPSDEAEMTIDEADVYIGMLSAQIYLPARQLIIDLLERMGVRISLPLSVELEKN